MIIHHKAQPLTDGRYQALVLLAIPTAILSIFGSSAIIYMVYKTRKSRRWSPYTRLLLGMSICDIILSLHLAMGTFMRPEDTSNRVWAFGNDATCTASGFFGQLSLSAIMYNGMLSLYFLLSARFRWSNSKISNWIEPLMHIICVGYPLVTATIGAIYGFFSEPELGLGCVVNDYPRGCGDGPGKTGEYCLSITIGWIYMGVPRLTTGTAIVCNNVAIWAFVRRQTRPARRHCSLNKSSSSITAGDQMPVTTIMDGSSSSHNNADEQVHVSTKESEDDDKLFDDDDSFTMNPPVCEEIQPRVENEQHRRLYLIRSQAFLFVGSYFLCNFWVGLTVFLEGLAENDAEEMQMACQFYAVLVLYSFFAPLQGFFNMLVFMRPKYAKYRYHFPEETKLWAFRRTLLGDDAVPPTAEGPIMCEAPDFLPQKVSHQEDTTPKQSVAPLEMEDVDSAHDDDSNEGSIEIAPECFDTQKCIPLTDSSIVGSSLILSMEEKSDGKDLNDKRGNNKQKMASWAPMQQARRHQSSQWGSSLETISELSQMSFVEEVVGSDRWNAGSKPLSSASRMPLTIPERPESLNEVESDYNATDGRKPPGPPSPRISGADSPISVPRRKLSPPPSSPHSSTAKSCKQSPLPANLPGGNLVDCGIRIPQRKLSPIVSCQ